VMIAGAFRAPGGEDRQPRPPRWLFPHVVTSLNAAGEFALPLAGGWFVGYDVDMRGDKRQIERVDICDGVSNRHSSEIIRASVYTAVLVYAARSVCCATAYACLFRPVHAEVRRRRLQR